MNLNYSNDYVRQSDIDIKSKVSKLIEKENNEQRRVELGLMLEFSDMFVGLKNALITSLERLDKEHLEHAEKLNRVSSSLLEHIESTNALMNKAKGARNIIPIFLIIFTLTGSLIGVIYHNLIKNIDIIQQQHSVLLTQQSNLQTNQTAIQNQQVQIMNLMGELSKQPKQSN